MSYESATAFPLYWPQGVPRHTRRMRARFNAKDRHLTESGIHRVDTRSLTTAEALRRLQREVDLLGAHSVVLSTNIELRLDGLPYSNRREPDDPGACLYFHLRDKPHAMPCDVWDRVADNIIAIAKHIEAVRGISRWGVADVAQMFSGFAELPQHTGSPPAPWREVLSLEERATLEEAEAAYRKLAKHRHPDLGGSDAEMAEVNRAIAAAREELAPST